MADTWQYANSHIDEAIKVPNSFISAARCIIYVAKDQSTFHRIGVIQGYNWGEQKQIEMIFEIGSDIPYIVPGRTTGQISISRMLLFSQDILNAFNKAAEGTDILNSLKDAKNPFDMMFVAFNNNQADEANASNYKRTFKNCWMQSRNESITAGQVLIAENVTIMYEQVSKVETDVSIGGPVSEG